MTLPVVPVTRPSNIVGLTSAQIGACHLEAVFFPGIGYSSLNPAAARCWRALSIACLAETNQTLTATSTGDVFRSLAQQTTSFYQRYHTPYVEGRDQTGNTRTVNGVKYYLLKGAIPMAVPGGGNHPLGLAVDVALYDPLLNDSDPYPGDPRWIRSNAWLWAWLVLNVVSLGWSWENASEGVDDPHLHYFAGDSIPQRVLDIENWLAAHA